METCIPVPCCQVDARFGPCGMGVCENAHDPCGMGCGNVHELYGNAYERRDYFHGEWALMLCGMRDAWGGVIAGGVAVGRIVAMAHCRNGVLTKRRIALPCCCNDALPHRGVVAALASVSEHRHVVALPRCRIPASQR